MDPANKPSGDKNPKANIQIIVNKINIVPKKQIRVS